MNSNISRKWHYNFELLAESDNELIKEKVTTKELFILYLVHKLRCLSPRELSKVLDEHWTHSLVYLSRIEEKGLLYSDYTDFYGCTQRVFFTTNEGIEKVAELLGTEVYSFDNKLDKYIPNFHSQTENKISSNYMPHFLATNDFYLALLRNGIAVDWKDSRFNALFDGDIRKAPIRLDASYQINGDFYGIEQDMGTADKTRTLAKFTSYANYFPVSKFNNTTLYFSINMGKYLNIKKLEKLGNEYKENEKKIKELKREKKKYTEAKKLVKEYPVPPSEDEINELEMKKQAIEELLESPVLSRWEKRRQEKTLSDIKSLINKEYPKPEDDLKIYEGLINNSLLAESERKRLMLKKEVLLTYKQIVDDTNLDDKIKEITLQMRELKTENDRIKEEKERSMLVESAHTRRSTVLSYIDYQIHNKENDNTLLDLFIQGLDMYMDESILLSKFAAKQIKKQTTLDYLISYINGFIQDLFNEIGNTILFDSVKKVKYENFAFTVDYGIKMYRKNLTGNPIFIDIFDICDNNVASNYRFKEYMKTKRDEKRYFSNRLTICLVSSKEKITEIKERFPYDIDNIWFYEEDINKIDFSNMLCFKEDKLEQVITQTDLTGFLRKING